MPILSSPEKAVKTLDKIFCFLEVDNININCRSVKYKKLHSLHPVEMVTNQTCWLVFYKKMDLLVIYLMIIWHNYIW